MLTTPDRVTDPITAEMILALIFVMLIFYAVVLWAYVHFAGKRLAKEHKERRDSLAKSPMLAALLVDQQLVFYNYVIRNAEISEKKRLMFQALRNSLLIVGGAMPLASIMINNTLIQRIMSVGASLAVLIMGVFAIEANATNHRRSGYMINTEIETWRSGIGEYIGIATPTERFQFMVGKVRTILDSVETSFVGAGVEATEPYEDDVDLENPHSSGAYGLHSLTTAAQQLQAKVTAVTAPAPSQEEFERMPIAMPTAVGRGSGPPIPITPDPVPEASITDADILAFNDVFGEEEEEIEITQSRDTAVPQSDFANWQATALGQQIEITQARGNG